MTTADSSAKNKPIPSFELESTAGDRIGPGHFRQRKSLVLCFCPKADTPECRAVIEALEMEADEFQRMNAEILGIIGGDLRQVQTLQSDGKPGFTLLMDPDRNAARKTLADDEQPTIVVCDRFGAIWEQVRIAEITPKEAVDKTADTLAFMALQCPECGVPDRPTP